MTGTSAVASTARPRSSSIRRLPTNRPCKRTLRINTRRKSIWLETPDKIPMMAIRPPGRTASMD
jgi:hypothetical protein